MPPTSTLPRGIAASIARAWQGRAAEPASLRRAGEDAGDQRLSSSGGPSSAEQDGSAIPVDAAPGGPLRVALMLGLPLTGQGPSYTAIHLAKHMAGEGLHIDLHVGLNHLPSESLPFRVFGLSVSGPKRLRNLLSKYFADRLSRAAEDRLIRHVQHGRYDAIYTVGEVSLAFARRCQALGIFVVREKINCGKQVAHDILAPLYRDQHIPMPATLQQQGIAKEKAELDLADAVFAPSPMVRHSLRAIGIADERILPTSYGWEPARFVGDTVALPPVEGPTLLFVGYICHRKGAHLLLEAWQKAAPRGRLVLVGRMEPQIEQRFADVLARPDVVVLPYTHDVGAVYRSADWFVFPSLEEGGPQVTYEAAGNGLPAIVSDMGAGAFTRNGVDGVVLQSTDATALAAVLASLPDGDQRAGMARNAQQRASSFVWEEVGAKRRQLLLAAWRHARPRRAAAQHGRA